MSLFNNAIIGASGQQGYQISRSVRLRSSASAYFNRTPASAGNSQKFTWSGWVKRGTLTSGYQVLFMGGNTLNDYTVAVYFNSSDQLAIRGYTGVLATTTAVYRDPSAWYHIVASVDTTQTTGTDRLRLYVNGVLVASGSITQNWNFLVNTTVAHTIGNQSVAWGYNYFDGYMTEINFIDGQQLTPSSFGQNDPVTGVWKPKKYAGTYGTNGFYLNFSDNSAATAAAIGKDYSGNGNNWTPNNISVTAGVTYDSMLDTPTPYADGGNGRGNYCVGSPINYRTTTPTPTVSDGNLKWIGSSASLSSIGCASMGVSSGKWYWEVTRVGTNTGFLGVVNGQFNATTSSAFDLGYNSNEYAYISSGNKVNNNSSVAYGASYTSGDVIGVALDLSAGTLTFYKNNVSQGTAYSGLTLGDYWTPAFDSYNGAGFTLNFGQQPFIYTPPTGFKALNTQNLPDATIKAGNKYFDATLYTGNGSATTVVNAGAFQPDLVWVKSRSAVGDGGISDSSRQSSGLSYVLYSDSTAAESLGGAYVNGPFNSNGFTTTNNGGSNANGTTYVGWQWKKGATQGFDIVTYTGTGANTTVAHSLGVKPSLIIIKPRSAANPWPVYHVSLGATKYMLLNTTDAAATNATFMNNTEPTSSVFSLGSGTYVNSSTVTHVAYLFAEVAGFSKFGSYTGNGSADGPFVYCGFRPKFVMVKRTDASGYAWVLMDSARSTYNVAVNSLAPNASDGEYTNLFSLDMLSNGFKWRSVQTSENASGGTYIFAAFAEVPFKAALAR